MNGTNNLNNNHSWYELTLVEGAGSVMGSSNWIIWLFGSSWSRGAVLPAFPFLFLPLFPPCWLSTDDAFASFCFPNRLVLVGACSCAYAWCRCTRKLRRLVLSASTTCRGDSNAMNTKMEQYFIVILFDVLNLRENNVRCASKHKVSNDTTLYFCQLPRYRD